jgi:hypothetical protein
LKQAVTPETGRLSQLLTESLQPGRWQHGECRQKFLELEKAQDALMGSGWEPDPWVSLLESLNAHLRAEIPTKRIRRVPPFRKKM